MKDFFRGVLNVGKRLSRSKPSCSDRGSKGSAAGPQQENAWIGDSVRPSHFRPKPPISLKRAVGEGLHCAETCYAQAACVGLTGCTARKLIAIRFHALIAATATVRFTSSVLEKTRLASS